MSLEDDAPGRRIILFFISVPAITTRLRRGAPHERIPRSTAARYKVLVIWPKEGGTAR